MKSSCLEIAEWLRQLEVAGLPQKHKLVEDAKDRVSDLIIV